jgi:hypothetical protein
MSMIDTLIFSEALFKYLLPFCLNLSFCFTQLHVTSVHPQVTDGEDQLQIWRVAASILNEHIQRANRGWSSSMDS